MSTNKPKQALPDSREAFERFVTRGVQFTNWHLWQAAVDFALTQRQQGVLGRAEVLPTDAQVIAAARTLNRCAADACGMDEQDSWKIYGDVYKGDAREALHAAINAAPPAQPQSELLAMDLLRTDFKRECDDTDMILRMLGLEPENCRTDGGSLKTGMILDALEARDRLICRAALAAQPPERAAQQEAQEPTAWQERVQLDRGKWSEWYERSSGWSLDGVREIDSGGIKYQFRPLYASPPQAVEPMQALIEQINRLPRATANEFDDYESDGTPRSFRRPFVSLRKVVELIRTYEDARGIGKQRQG